MTQGKYDRSIELHCPTCSSTQFEYDEHQESAAMLCTCCGLSLSRTDLITANGENIGVHVEQVKREVVDDLKKKLQQSFKGSKLFKVK